MKICIAKPLCFSALGQKPNQEDALFPEMGAATCHSRVFLVCDGMGGHEHGEVASRCVAETIGRCTASNPPATTGEMKLRFEEALQQAFDRLNELDQTDSVRKMGTTLTFLALCTNGVLVAHIGDSRVYQFRPGKGVVFQTRDHSLVNDLIAAGELSEEEAKTFPQRNVITRAVQPHQDDPAKAAFNVLADVRAGDVFFLCCDGVLEQLDNKDLEGLLLSNRSLEERLQAVEKECRERTTRDNNTAYLLEVTEVGGNDRQASRGLSPTQAQRVEPAAAEDRTAEMRSMGADKRRMNKATLVIAVCVVVILTILAFLFMDSPEAIPSEKKSVPVQVDNRDNVGNEYKVEKKDSTQGNIRRNK